MVLGLDQLFFILFVGLGQDEDGLALLGELGVIVLSSASAVVEIG